MRKFVTFESDWADEFTVYGFRIFTNEEWETYKKELHEHSGSLSFYFGTNEGWDEETADHFLSNMTATDISEDDVAKLVEIFNLKKAWKDYLEWGTFPDFDYNDECYDEL